MRVEAWKSQDFNGVWTRYLAIPVRRSNQLSYEATDVGSWSFVSSNEPVKNGCEVIYDVIVADFIWSDDIVRPTITVTTVMIKQNLFTEFLFC